MELLPPELAEADAPEPAVFLPLAKAASAPAAPKRSCFVRSHVRRTMVASCVLQGFCVAFLAFFEPYGGEWKATLAAPLAAFEHTEMGEYFVFVCGIILYMIDFLPEPADANLCVKLINRVFAAAALAVLMLALVAQSQYSPALLMAACLLALPLLAMGLQRTVLAGRLSSSVLTLVAVNLFASAVCIGLGWLTWVYAGNRWMTDNRTRWMARLGCDDDAACRQRAYLLWASGGILSTVCAFFALAAWLLARITYRASRWELARIGGLAAAYRARARLPPSHANPVRSRAVALAALHVEVLRIRHRLDQAGIESRNAVKVVSGGFATLGFGIYVAAAVAGAGMNLSHAFVSFLCAALVGLALCVGTAIGFRQLLSSVTTSPMVRLFRDSIDAELGVACGLFFGGPLGVVYLCAAFCNQRVRDLTSLLCRRGRRRGSEISYLRRSAESSRPYGQFAAAEQPPPSEAPPEAAGGNSSSGSDGSDPEDGYDNERASPAGVRLGSSYRPQPPAPPITAAQPPRAGAAPPHRHHAGRRLIFTALAHEQLDWLIQRPWAPVLEKLQLIALLLWLLLYGSTLTYMGLASLVGYLENIACPTASLAFVVVGLILFLLPPVPGLAVYLCSGVIIPPACEPSLGFYGSCAHAAILAFVMKLTAQVLQQKGIGGQLGGSVAVRRAVGVNAAAIKAIRHILMQPGLSVAKVAILCGGPDWPTAVLCGILDVPLSQMLLALTPMIVFTVPAALAGAFQLHLSDASSLDEPFANLFAMVTTLQSLALGVTAFYHIQRVKETAPLVPNDVEVEALEAHEERHRAATLEATRLDRAPVGPLLFHLSGTATLVASSYLLIFASSRCFEEFSLTDDVSEGLCLDCERAAIKPLGWAALAMLLYALVCRYVWRRWAGEAAAAAAGKAPAAASTAMV